MLEGALPELTPEFIQALNAVTSYGIDSYSETQFDCHVCGEWHSWAALTGDEVLAALAFMRQASSR